MKAVTLSGNSYFICSLLIVFISLFVSEIVFICVNVSRPVKYQTTILKKCDLTIKTHILGRQVKANHSGGLIVSNKRR